MRINKLVIVQKDETDFKRELLEKVLQALEPVRKFTAIHKAKKALEPLQVGLSVGERLEIHCYLICENNRRVWFKTEFYGKDRPVNCEQVYQYIKEELGRYAGNYEPSVSEYGMEKWIQGYFNENECNGTGKEMKQQEFEQTKKQIIKRLQQAIKCVKQITPEGGSFEFEEES